MEAADATKPTGEDVATPLPKRRVLIVDDEQDFTFMTALTLQQMGNYEVREENDAAKALAAAREFKPDVILLDVMMPELDGGDVVAQLRAEHATRDIPVIFLTALVRTGDAETSGLTSGGHRFVPKPVSFDELTAYIDEVLSGAGR